MNTDNLQALEILTFWFGNELSRPWPRENRSDLWFGSSKETDKLIKDSFENLVEDALSNKLTHWEDNCVNRLALIILLDQFTRNIYRGTDRAFSGDSYARSLSLRTIDSSEDINLTAVARIFLYIPLMHSEDLDDQDLSVNLYTTLYESSSDRLKTALLGSLTAAINHRNVIKQFKRFPHRNRPLGRPSTDEELEYIKT
jgi:uncharacterized protein (DUF924 family)